VAANTGTARSGSVTIAGQTFMVAQAAPAPPPPACTISISPNTLDVGKHGGAGSITVTASAPSCTWTATTNTPWLTVTNGASGTGNGTVTFAAADNPGGDRAGTLSIGGQTFTVTQRGSDDIAGLSPALGR
jgi:hypothetical protein